MIWSNPLLLISNGHGPMTFDILPKSLDRVEWLYYSEHNAREFRQWETNVIMQNIKEIHHQVHWNVVWFPHLWRQIGFAFYTKINRNYFRYYIILILSACHGREFKHGEINISYCQRITDLYTEITPGFPISDISFTGVS